MVIVYNNKPINIVLEEVLNKKSNYDCFSRHCGCSMFDVNGSSFEMKSFDTYTETILVEIQKFNRAFIKKSRPSHGIRVLR